MQKEFWAQIHSITSVAKNTFQVTFSLEAAEIHFIPGQYIWLILPELHYPDPRGSRRAFSIISPAEQKSQISIMYRCSASGYKRTLMELKPGTKVRIAGPFGSSYIIHKPTKKDLVLIAGGVGIAPFLSIVRSSETYKNLSLVYVNSHVEKAAFAEELEVLCGQKKYKFKEAFGSFTGTVLQSMGELTEKQFLICGPEGFVNAVYEYLSKKKVKTDQLQFEEFYPFPRENLTEEDFVLKPGERNIMLQAVHDSKNHVIVTDANGRIIFANNAAQMNTGYSFEEMRGNTPRLWGGVMTSDFYHNFWKKKHEKKGFDGEIINRKKNGVLYYVLAHISPITSQKGNIIGYIGTEEDITKEKQMDKAKTEFISLASHQLRTPLSTINWYCELLLEGDAGKLTPDQQKFVHEAYRGSQRMAQLVNALLNVTRLESGSYKVEPEEIDIVKLTRSVLHESKPLIDEKNLHVHLEKADVPPLMLDPNLMLIILENLITNSIKYTLPHGKVTIYIKKIKKGIKIDSVSVKRDSLLIQVTDTGMGIPANEQSQIFDKLYRATNVRQANTDGTGLGLYLTKLLIEQSHGKVWFHSQEEKGTTFYVLLPLSGMIKKEGKKKLEWNIEHS